MISKENKKNELPVIRINKDLNKYKGKILFPDLLEKTNEMLKKTKLPDEYYTRQRP